MKTKKAFTILELLLYVGILSIVIFSIAFFSQTLLSARIKNQTISEVEQQGQIAMQHITQIIRNSSMVTAPLEGASGASLTVETYESASNPTIFSLVNDAIHIKEGSSNSLAVTSSRIVASGLSFQNMSAPGTPGTVRIQFTLSHVNPNGKNEFQYSKTFYASASIRK